jgi:hypothetical protein
MSAFIILDISHILPYTRSYLPKFAELDGWRPTNGPQTVENGSFPSLLFGCRTDGLVRACLALADLKAP